MRIGVIGAAGRIGRLRVQTILDNPATTLAAVHDLTLDRARAIADGAPAFDDIDIFFGTPMDAVVISVPAHVREPLCLEAFRRGLHVLTEKPLAPTVEGGRRIVEAAKAAHRALGGGFNMRFYPAFAFVRDVVQSGRVGEIDHVRVHGGHAGLANFTHDWEYRSEFSGGGALWDVGIHMTDLVQHILGDITEVYGVTSNRVWQVEGSEDNAIAIFRNPDGIPAIYQATWNDWQGYRSAIEVVGTRGMVRGQYAPMRTTLVTMDEPGGATRTERNFFPEIMVREKLQSWTSTALRSFAGELQDFLKMCRGQTLLRAADGHAALKAIEVASAVAEASRSGAPVRLENRGPMTTVEMPDGQRPEPGKEPVLSIVLTVVQGRDYVKEFLDRVRAFENPPPLDVVVPYDASIYEIGEFKKAYPEVRFIDLGLIATQRPITSEAGKHELYDRRRSAGLKAAEGDYVAILEDRGLPRKDWAHTVMRLFQETGRHVIGGAIECMEPSSALNWSLYVTDFGRYGLPFDTAAADWVTDLNLAYSRWALEETRPLWAERYHEPIVHWHLIGLGEDLWLSNEVVVKYRRPRARLSQLVPERFDWGRLFGELRVRDAPLSRRLALIAAGPLIPPLLWVRHYRLQKSKGRGGRYLRALPYVMLLTTAWTAGEVWGYVTRRP